MTRPQAVRIPPPPLPRPNRGAPVSVTQAAAELGVSKMSVYRRIHEGDLPAIRVGRSLRVYRNDLEKYIADAFKAVEDE